MHWIRLWGQCSLQMTLIVSVTSCPKLLAYFGSYTSEQWALEKLQTGSLTSSSAYNMLPAKLQLIFLRGKVHCCQDQHNTKVPWLPLNWRVWDSPLEFIFRQQNRNRNTLLAARPASVIREHVLSFRENKHNDNVLNRWLPHRMVCYSFNVLSTGVQLNTSQHIF